MTKDVLSAARRIPVTKGTMTNLKLYLTVMYTNLNITDSKSAHCLAYLTTEAQYRD